MIPAFSVAISASVVPSSGTWSSPTGSTTAVPASTTLVASQAPPRPTSSTATSTGASAKTENAIPVSTSKKVIGTGRPLVDQRDVRRQLVPRLDEAVLGDRLPSTTIRSVTESRCGLV
jgi:hypothetical protein